MARNASTRYCGLTWRCSRHATAWHHARPALAFGHFAPVVRGAMPQRAAELYVRPRRKHPLLSQSQTHGPSKRRNSGRPAAIHQKMKLIHNFRSLLAGFRASAALGRGFRERDRGDRKRAAQLAQTGLALLRRPYVRRMRPVEGSALASLTVLAEEVRESSSDSGANQQDLADAIAIIRRTALRGGNGLSEWLPQLEKRLAMLRTQSEA